MLERACAGDEQLRLRVRHLLAQQEMRTLSPGPDGDEARPPHFAQSDAGHSDAGRGGSVDGLASVAVREETAPDPLRGRKLGRYAILETLGEGGMGTVYLAEQDSPRRLVALKVIRSGLLSRGALRRFEAESSVLGRLHHPGIAQVYEAGTARLSGEEGAGAELPFFAMEYVRGSPLTEYARSRGLGVRQRLALVALVCDAVQHAHTKGVIHRDLKPGNILVEDVDAGPRGAAGVGETARTTLGEAGAAREGLTGQPKVLDFGIARVTDADGGAAGATLQTGVGQLVGTLAYMSPEQVSGDPRDLDTRSDVYTLGVILYELLAGRLPHDVAGRTIPEAARMIAADPPTGLASVDRSYRGEIQTIVLKAIEKDKRRRYQSARELADDLRRHLADEPIAARPPSAAYRFSKFARRNRGLVAGLGAAAGVLALGVAGVGWQAARATAGWATAERNLRLAEDAKRAAEEAAANARAVSGFLTDMITAVDPETAVGRELTARELFEAAALAADASPPGTPRAELGVRAALAQSLRGIGRAAEARAQLERAVARAREVYGPDAPETVEALRGLTLAIAETGKIDEALEAARGTHALVLARYGRGHLLTAMAEGDLGRVLGEAGRNAEAEGMLRGAAAAVTRALGPDHRDALTFRNNLATVLKALGKLEEAERLQRAVVEAHARTLPEGHPQLLSARNNLATILQRRGKDAEAAEMLRSVVAARERVQGPGSVPTAASRLNLAVCLMTGGDAAGAEREARAALGVLREKLGPEHPKTLVALGALGYILEDSGRLSEAEGAYREVVAARRRAGAAGGGDPEVWGAINNLAMFLQEKAGRPGEALGLYEELMGLCAASLPSDHYAAAIFRSNYGSCLAALGRREEAERELLAAQGVLEKALGAGHARSVKNAARLAALYDGWGKGERAAEWRARGSAAAKPAQ
jgi:serine/threonine protein kinase